MLTAAHRLNTLALSTPESKAIYNDLKAYRRQLADALSKPLMEQSGVAQLEEKANATEKELARTVAGYATAVNQVNWQAVQSKLQPSEAAIEFVHFQVVYPNITDSTVYAALILLPGAAAPHFVPLFEEKSLDSLLGLHQQLRSDYVNDLYAFANRGIVAAELPRKPLPTDLATH
ncbi:MAG: hypothetical protein IPL65_00525 [Lewinellaceae bacterium]|nr:hypothetical protein [Lewinellaceae bacterium]